MESRDAVKAPARCLSNSSSAGTNGTSAAVQQTGQPAARPHSDSIAVAQEIPKVSFPDHQNFASIWDPPG